MGERRAVRNDAARGEGAADAIDAVAQSNSAHATSAATLPPSGPDQSLQNFLDERTSLEASIVSAAFLCSLGSSSSVFADFSHSDCAILVPHVRESALKIIPMRIPLLLLLLLLLQPPKPFQAFVLDSLFAKFTHAGK